MPNGASDDQTAVVVVVGSGMVNKAVVDTVDGPVCAWCSVPLGSAEYWLTMRVVTLCVATVLR